MMNHERGAGRLGPPPRQNAARTAQQKAVELLRGQTETQLRWLGAARDADQWRLPALDGALVVDLESGDVVRQDGQSAQPSWRLLALHYLAVRARPEPQPPEVTFASLPEARTYAVVYANRVNRRLCATAGRDIDTLRAAAAAVQAQAVPGGDAAFQVHVFPRIPLHLIWYAGDEELAPSCTLLLPANIEEFLCTEDIVVLSESFVSRLSGKPF